MINKVVLVVIGVLYLLVLHSCSMVQSVHKQANYLGDWELSKSKDTYSGEWVVSDEGLVFSFLKDGVFKKYDKYAKLCIGSYLQSDSLFTISHDCNARELQYKLESIKREDMLLSVVGRHGKVFYQFVKK